MKFFTRWLYLKAIRRALKREHFEFCQHQSAFCGPERWISARRQTNLLMVRYEREREIRRNRVAT